MNYIKKPIIALATAGLILLGSSGAMAQTTATSSSVEELIRQLQNQINALRAQIETLTAARTAVQTTTTEIRDTLRLISGLREGMTGEEVRLLQITLSSDPDIYPEGLVTGFYGSATASAVRRFQAKNNLETVGFVGPRTLAKLNETLKNNPVVKDEKTGEHCAIIPPGHLIAPGWLRKTGGVRPVVPTCQNIPPGITEQLNALAAKDMMKPQISGTAATEITINSARISWMTDEPTKGLIRYGTTTPLSSGQVLELEDNNPKTTHGHVLTGLMPNTVYYYTITATDNSGNATTSSEYMMRTLSTDTTAPVISGVTATDITQTSARIVWTTNEPATSKVWLTTNMSVNTSGSPTMESSSFAANHSMMFSNLTFGTVYRYVVASTDSSGNTTTSSEYSFTTASGGGGGGGY